MSVRTALLSVCMFSLFLLLHVSSATMDDRCLLDADPGSCKALVTRWFYNQNTGSCDTFVYGGCQGNWNNFESEHLCKVACLGEPCICTAQYDPVCSTEGNTFSNLCRLICAHQTLDYYGVCRDSENTL
jgi:hypothetical protein